METLAPSRLRLARERSSLQSKELADRCGVTPQTVSNWETGLTTPGAPDLEKVASVTGFPVSFFYLQDMEDLPDAAVSFRARSRLQAKPRRAALASARMARELATWIEARFELPPVSLRTDLVGQPPDLVAEAVRSQWMLGDRPIPNLIRVLEARGILVFSLAREVRDLDAFSFWWNDRPIMLLNTMKSAERSRMDAAHELMHLVAHRERTDKKEEEEANRFAGALLMPRSDLIKNAPRQFTVPLLTRAKQRWGVALSALVYRLHELELMSDWQYRYLFLEMNKRRFLQEEPSPMPERERSVVLPQIFRLLAERGRKPADVARELHWHRSHLDELIFGLGAAMLPVVGGAERGRGKSAGAAKLRLVE